MVASGKKNNIKTKNPGSSSALISERGPYRDSIAKVHKENDIQQRIL